eukprot:3033032-Ditylum_brightwellii.AAC.1
MPNRCNYENTHDARQASTKVGGRQHERKDATRLLNSDGYLHYAKMQVRKGGEGGACRAISCTRSSSDETTTNGRESKFYSSDEAAINGRKSKFAKRNISKAAVAQRKPENLCEIKSKKTWSLVNSKEKNNTSDRLDKQESLCVNQDIFQMINIKKRELHPQTEERKSAIR